MPIRELISAPITNEQRRRSFKEKLTSGRALRFIESHSPISAMISEKVYVAPGALQSGFDGFRSNSLTDSTLRGRPAIEILDIASRLLNVQSLERSGVPAVIIEDKTGLKKNSLLGNDVIQHQESIDDFQIIARVESLILDKGMPAALARGRVLRGRRRRRDDP
ncbi:product [Burkholderia humptydooensis MSMB43]|uniref:Product n=1 Tax=Burkholderia humptydooensis MSMB43 TaxID=441157 RepID=A0ABN0G4R1_9BURK|nr:product [Burkholderia humptydooensis MSMB43]